MEFMPPADIQEIILSLVTEMTQKVHQFNIHTQSPYEIKLMRRMPDKIKGILRMVSLDENLFDVSMEMDTSNDEEMARKLSMELYGETDQ